MGKILYRWIMKREDTGFGIVMSLIKEGHSIAKIMSATKSVVSLLVGIAMDPNRKIVAAVSSYFKPTVFDRVDFIEDVLLPALQQPSV